MMKPINPRTGPAGTSRDNCHATEDVGAAGLDSAGPGASAEVAGKAALLRTVVALYIDPRGPYPRMSGVDCWDESRDARSYGGPHPVVAHPPCGPWGNLRHMRQLRREADAECGPRAVEQVRAYGGVLEQPAGSKLWDRCDVPRPGRLSVGGDLCIAFGGADPGYSIAVEQVSWGHPARKPTWLYLVGVPWELVRSGLRSGGTPTHWCSGGRKRSSGSGGLVPPGIKVCSAQQRRRTPTLLAEWLVSLARAARIGG